jgi:hypothetical protein
MRTRPVVLSLALSAAIGLLAETAAVSQENRGTLEQQMACTPDVFRLCGEQIPDANRILVCLRQNTAQLSGPCRAVFESNASVPQQQAAPRQRHAQPPINLQPRPYDDDNNQ